MYSTPKQHGNGVKRLPVICEGGVGRIRLYGVPEYDHGDIHIDCFVNIKCDLVKILPLLQNDYSGAL